MEFMCKSKMCVLGVYLGILPIVLHASTAFGIPAFPGAEGFGNKTFGGRGTGSVTPQVFVVDTLADTVDAGDGLTSVREAVQASGPRFIVFAVSGTIVLRHPLDIRQPYITIAGQTAPGDGIAFRNDASNTDPVLIVHTHDVVLRYLRLRPGPSAMPSSNVDALQIISPPASSEADGNVYNIMVDHCSMSWATDEVMSIYEASDITVQWSIIAEGLLWSTHEKSVTGAMSHSMGMMLYLGCTDISLHHNLFAHNLFRNPQVRSGTIDIVNNVLYNVRGYIDGSFSSTSIQDGSPTHLNPEGRPIHINFVGNYHKRGPDSARASHSLQYEVGTHPNVIYLEGNIGPFRPDGAGAETLVVNPASEGGSITAERFAVPAVTTSAAADAYGQVLACVGASLPVRDCADGRVVDDVLAGSGRHINDPSEVGGWPTLAAGTAPSDDDNDGLPDDWERAHGLNPVDAADALEDRDSDGYLNIEEYINGLVESGGW